MVIRENPANGTLKIWVDNSEKDTYKENSEYKEAVSTFKNTHRICVLVGGTQPIVPTISSLLDAQNRPRVYA
jgi:hypothetical protein